ncbi:MAG TPA: hypothetical protein VMT45_12100 [Thermoanaerobaculaceae bacterium]|nr:hypothetical protein [Thermoanaerobaculaceae bacterium]
MKLERGVLLRKLEWWLVVLIALHTYGIGVGLLALPEWALRFGGWQTIPPLFFPRQAGVFHLVLGTGYLLEYRRLRSFSLLLIAKSCAFVFLVGATMLATVPWFVTFAGVADGLMGLAVVAVHAAVSRVEGPVSPAGAS